MLGVVKRERDDLFFPLPELAWDFTTSQYVLFLVVIYRSGTWGMRLYEKKVGTHFEIGL